LASQPSRTEVLVKVRAYEMSRVEDEPFFLTARGSFSTGGLSAIVVDEI
jgi:hypothetical protein